MITALIAIQTPGSREFRRDFEKSGFTQSHRGAEGRSTIVRRHGANENISVFSAPLCEANNVTRFSVPGNFEVMSDPVRGLYACMKARDA